jgi:phosphatidylglycerophosphatase A
MSISATAMNRAERAPPRLLRHPLGLLALGFGSGLIPVAPGTAGTLAAIPLYLLVRDVGLIAYLVVTGVVFLAGIPVCAWAARRLGVHDHPAIVWDEIGGYLVSMIAVPPGWPWVLSGFVLFRLFDITKPWPIRWCDRRVGGGFGIMFDDLLAGVFAAVMLQVLYRLV